MSNTPQLLPLVWENTDLDSIVDTFERDGIVVLKGMFPQHWVSAADHVADRLLTQLDERPWAAGESTANDLISGPRPSATSSQIPTY